jgi:DNA-binding protein HU-beta/integration host factor subunit alpha
MNNKEFIAELSRRMGYNPAQTNRLMQSVISTMVDGFQEGNSLQVPNFGTFEVKKKLERIIVNPTTGQRMLVPPKLVLGFKPNANWKNMIKNGGEDNG